MKRTGDSTKSKKGGCFRKARKPSQDYGKPTKTDRRPSSSWEGAVESGRDAFPAGGETTRPDRLLDGGFGRHRPWWGGEDRSADPRWPPVCLVPLERTGRPARVGCLSVSFHSDRPAPPSVGCGRGEWMPRRAHRVGDRRHPRRSKLGVAC